MILLRQGEHGLGEEGDGLDVHGELAGARAEEIAGDSDVVAEVEKLVELEGLVADGVFADVDLQPLAVLLELRESRLALRADGHDASGDGDIGARGLEIFGGGVVVAAADFRERVRRGERIGIRGLAEGLDLL